VVSLMSDDATSFPDRVAALLADPLSVARAAAGSGQRVVGYVSAAGPVELILAARALPVRLRGPHAAPTPRADEFLESAFVPEMRAVAEQWLTGELDVLDAVVFPRNHDSAQRLYYYLCELQRRGLCRGPRPLLFDVAAIARTTSFEHTLASTRLLADSLGASAAELSAAAGRVAAREALLGLLAAQRAEASPLPGSDAQRAARAAEHDFREAFDLALARWLDQAPRSPHGKRLLFAGSSPPDERLLLAVEAGGGTVVRELVEIERAGAAGSAALEAVARRHHGARSPAQRMLESAEWLAGEARALRADGVVLWLIEEDEALPWEAAGQIRALQDAGVPVLALTRQRWLADQAALDAVREFVRTLAGKS
jgi:hypothetical protein